MKRILVVDDERGPRESLRAIFSRDYEVTTVENAALAMRALAEKTFDLMLLDVIMPKVDGVAFLKDAQSIYPGLPVIMISASHAVRPVVEAMRLGAHDYVSKPFDVEEIQHIVRRAMENTRLQRRLQSLETEVAREFPVQDIVGESDTFRLALEHVRKAAETDATVLIHGESGTGKELAARLLHTLSKRRNEPFVPVHCGALSESLMESELFGHEKGAFTGAIKMKPGRFDLAGSGTIFFDEASEMTLMTQVKLLRVLQEREFMRVGGTRVIHTDARIVAATAKNLLDEAQAGRFREDLYYRIGVVPITLPPLRERLGDIPLLARHFLEHYAGSMDARCRAFDEDALALMCRYRWPGNVRELRNVVERMLVLNGQESAIRADYLPPEFHVQAQPADPRQLPKEGHLQDLVQGYERELIENALQRAHGVQTKAAKLLGTTRRILRYRLEKLNIAQTSEADLSDT